MRSEIKSRKVDQYLKEAKQSLYREFKRNPESWWKEEDLQSCLYKLLLNKNKEFNNLVHREYPLLTKLNPEKWGKAIKGNLDLVILEPTSVGDKSELNLNEFKIKHAIELKFPRKVRSKGRISCNHSPNDFAYNYHIDYKKLINKSKNAKNVVKDFQKHLLFFEKFDENKELFGSCEDMKRQIEDWAEKGEGRKFDRDKFDEIQFSYIEVYPNKKSSNLLNNCGLRGA